MIKITRDEFAKNVQKFQEVAQKEPVLVTDGDKSQILLDYDDYKKLTTDVHPAQNAYEAFFVGMSRFSHEEQEALANAEIEFDLSFLGSH